MTEHNGKVGKNWLIGALTAAVSVLVIGWANQRVEVDRTHTVAIQELRTSFAVINEKLDRLLDGRGGG